LSCCDAHSAKACNLSRPRPRKPRGRLPVRTIKDVRQLLSPVDCTAATPAAVEQFSADSDGSAADAGPSELTAACKSLFKKLCAKYDDLSNVDQLNKTLAKVEGVKMVMQENIEIALQNCVSLDLIDKQAEDLQAQAGMFKTRAKTLRSKVWWKLCKLRLMIVGVVLAVVAVVVIMICVHSGAFDDKDDDKK